MRKVEIRCPLCNKWIAKKDENVDAFGIYLWCPRCKHELIIKNNSALVADEL